MKGNGFDLSLSNPSYGWFYAKLQDLDSLKVVGDRLVMFEMNSFATSYRTCWLFFFENENWFNNNFPIKLQAFIILILNIQLLQEFNDESPNDFLKQFYV